MELFGGWGGGVEKRGWNGGGLGEGGGGLKGALGVGVWRVR